MLKLRLTCDRILKNPVEAFQIRHTAQAGFWPRPLSLVPAAQFTLSWPSANSPSVLIWNHISVPICPIHACAWPRPLSLVPAAQFTLKPRTVNPRAQPPARRLLARAGQVGQIDTRRGARSLSKLRRGGTLFPPLRLISFGFSCGRSPDI